MKKPGSEKKKSAGVKFDEAVIAEHDKERGTRQKIIEPKTPFHYASEDGQDQEASSSNGGAVCPKDLANKLNDHAKKAAFEEKRKAHYNEYEAVKAMKAKMAAGDDDDDE
uniref:Protein phosphatase inhibitor 2 n=1 Tax=Chromera velia CCMP2878 TaxID=1169474 RepID=A0A0G4F9G3_9ALVE|mmetsp:Transcript_53057/g.103827  ORF Transcript_53057/g.103827 Transcript_53057/m.103827 type:complete len:110 (+) Transcript_53057:172-501(+)|eukprot:Cvel_185.t1-p1 / transcript=Cvel_185.t1 / gene=Cvel_185 / organism=Chromera_velia_CCMP2878 / gene_product=hypothetical protein / transcript_product=hypothetical protein / location=Cvel_scaffold11:113343-113669(+) / protein_length=109 / sequence_SO=supercontig / SO=protein_coding / is_pseudo=false